MTIAPKTEKGRSFSDQEQAATTTEIPSEKESVMHNVINIPQAPAGFKREYFCTCGMGCTPDDLNTEDNCEIEGSVYAGPDVHLTDSTGTQVNSHWSPRNGITFDVSNYGFDSAADDAEYVAKAFTREQLEALPEMVEKVLAKIDQAHAVEVMTAHPVPRANPEFHTVTELGMWCDKHGIGAVAGLAAFTELHGAENGFKGGADNA